MKLVRFYCKQIMSLSVVPFCSVVTLFRLHDIKVFEQQQNKQKPNKTSLCDIIFKEALRWNFCCFTLFYLWTVFIKFFFFIREARLMAGFHSLARFFSVFMKIEFCLYTRICILKDWLFFGFGPKSVFMNFTLDSYT